MVTTICIAALLALWKLSDFGRHEYVCQACGGRGKHLKGCVWHGDGE